MGLAAMSLIGSALTVAAGGATSVPGLTSTEVDLGSIVTQSGYAKADFGAYIYGVDAYLHYVNTVLKGVNGRTLVMKDPLDDQSNPTQDSTDATTLVTADHVFAIVGVSTAFFNGSNYLSHQGNSTPVFGYATSNVWKGPKNFFADYGSVIDYASSLPDFAYVASQLKATKVAVLAYDWPSSDAECQPAVNSLLKTYKIPVVYSNMNEPLLLANFSSDVTHMVNDHVNMIISCMQGSDDVALTKLLGEAGVKDIPQIWLDGYDRTLLARDANYMNDVYLLIQHAPFEAYEQYPKSYPGIGLYLNQMTSYFKAAYPSTYTSYLPDEYDDVALMGWESAICSPRDSAPPARIRRSPQSSPTSTRSPRTTAVPRAREWRDPPTGPSRTRRMDLRRASRSSRQPGTRTPPRRRSSWPSTRVPTCGLASR